MSTKISVLLVVLLASCSAHAAPRMEAERAPVPCRLRRGPEFEAWLDAWLICRNTGYNDAFCTAFGCLMVDEQRTKK